jgi:hypothetical protein
MLDVHEEDDGLAGPLRRELLARRRPQADLRLGPQQPAVRQGLPGPGSAPLSSLMVPRRCVDPKLEPSPSSPPRSRWTWI